MEAGHSAPHQDSPDVKQAARLTESKSCDSLSSLLSMLASITADVIPFSFGCSIFSLFTNLNY